jgi:pimeloyl-ACP methyl ester carboxylesterase
VGVAEVSLGGAPATVVEPERDEVGLVYTGPTSAGIVVAHGGEADGRHFFVDEAVELSRLGATVVLPSCGIPILGDRDVDEATIRGAVAVQRLALDLLAERGATRFGFFGHSAGAFQGAILAATEPRIEAFALAALGSGGAGRIAAARETLLPSRDEYVAAVERWEPARFLRQPRSRALLFQHALHDRVLSRRDARDLYQESAGPKEWREYDCDHGAVGALPEARADRLTFFAWELELR